METLMIALMAWASVFTGLPQPEHLPNVRVLERCEIEGFARGRLDPDCKNDSPHGVVAAYDYRTTTVLIPEAFDPQSVRHQAFLLHELVHHMQYASGMDMENPEPCRAAAIERPAYDAMWAYVEASGADVEETLRMNALFVVLVTSCQNMNGHEPGNGR
jgi:hypothetical protein